jgi:hypothetical protein
MGKGRKSAVLTMWDSAVCWRRYLWGAAVAISLFLPSLGAAEPAAPTGPPPTPTPTARQISTPAPSVAEGAWFPIGYSVEGRPILAVRLGSGPVRLAIMGGIHGGWERNTERLVQRLREYFAANREQILSNVSLYFVPVTNPDGFASGSNADAALNANGIDLNRNFDTPNWSPDVYGGTRFWPTGFRAGAGGYAPFSEPETRAMRDFVTDHRIAAVLSYHSGIVAVTAKDGGGGVAEALAAEVAEVTGYPYVAEWTAYPVTGQFVDWLDGVGVRGVELDLPTRDDTEWDLNLAAVEAVMEALAKQ